MEGRKWRILIDRVGRMLRLSLFDGRLTEEDCNLLQNDLIFASLEMKSEGVGLEEFKRRK